MEPIITDKLKELRLQIEELKQLCTNLRQENNELKEACEFWKLKVDKNEKTNILDKQTGNENF